MDFRLPGAPTPSQFDATLQRHYELQLAHRKMLLEQEYKALHDRQRAVKRKSRHEQILQQSKQLQELINQAVTTRVNVQSNQFRVSSEASVQNTSTASAIEIPISERNERDHNTTMHEMIKTLIAQNRELYSMISANNGVPMHSNQIGQNTVATVQNSLIVATPTSDKKSERSTLPKNVLAENSSILISEPPADARVPTPESVPVPSTPSTQQLQHRPKDPSPWSALRALPAVVWTADDDQLLEKLNIGTDDEQASLLPQIEADTSIRTDDTSLLQKSKNKETHDRRESRKKISLLMQASLAQKSGLCRPRWRIELDSENGVILPIPESGDPAAIEQPMPLRMVFRSAVLTVMAIQELKRQLEETKLAQKKRIMHEIEAMLNVYFDATRVWLSKLVKVPILSIVQDPTLDLDLSQRFNILQASKGLGRKFGTIISMLHARQPSSAIQVPGTESGTTSIQARHQARLVKLKVRVRGILDAFIKSIEKNDVPTGILECWKRLTTDGVYFPPVYELFDTEKDALGLDRLGGTQNMQEGGQRFNIVLLNFIFIRVLLPHVILRPWEIGISTTSKLPKHVLVNLQNVATLLYLICAKASPLPLIGEYSKSARRASVDSKKPNDQTDKDNKEDILLPNSRFLPIEAIHKLLIPDKVFSSTDEQLVKFCDEQRIRMERVLELLQKRLHLSELTNENVDNNKVVQDIGDDK